MALKNDFFSDTLFEMLSLAVSASEEEIQKAFDVLKVRVERGFMVTEEDKVKILQLEPKLYEPEYRLRSMILKGDFGSDGLDLQLKRLKKMLASKKIVPQEWIDVGASLHVVLRSPEFNELLLEACILTRNAAAQSQPVLTRAVDSVFQSLVDLQVAGVENAFKNFDRNTPMEHLNIVLNLPGLPPEVRQKALETMLECFWKPTQVKMTEIRNIKSSLATEKSEYNVKVLASRIEQEAKDGLIPVYDLFVAHAFKNQKKYLDEIRASLDEVVKLLKECHKPEKADFFIAKLTGQAPVKSVSAHSTSSVPKPKKSSETQLLKPVAEPRPASEKKQSAPPAEKTENVQEILQRIKHLTASGKLEQAETSLRQEIRKARTPDVKTALEAARQDPLFLLDANARPPKSSGLFPLKKETRELAPGHALFVLWFALGKSLPLLPLKAFVFRADTEECLGRIPMPRLKNGLQSLVAPLLGVLLLAAAVAAFFVLSPSADKQAEESYRALSLLSSPEERFSKRLDFLARETFRETERFPEVLRETSDLILDRLKTYESEGKLSDFMNRMGGILNSLDKPLKQAILQHIAPRFEQHFLENHFKPEDFFIWWLKTGSYGMAQSLLSKRIAYSQEQQDLNDVRRAVLTARKYLIRLPGALTRELLEKKIISKALSLLLVSQFSDLPEEVWRSSILELWELRSPLSDDEGLLVLEKTGDHFPELRTDLLQAVLDKNKKNQIPWPDKVEAFQDSSVEKRVKLLACRYLVQHGQYEDALKLSKTMPAHPENSALYSMRLPLFFIQGQYFRVRHFFEKLHPSSSTTDEFYKFLRGLACVRTATSLEEWKQASSILGPAVIARFEGYLLLWRHLHEREAAVRKMVIEKLKSKKGSYYEVYRRIYLIQDDKEAAREKEKFILSEIAADFNVKKIKAEIAEQRYVHEGIFGWVESSFHLRDRALLQKVEERLQDMKKVFYEPLTEIYLGQVFSLLEKQAARDKIFQDVEQACLSYENFAPLLALCKAYESLTLEPPLKKLTKIVLKKCKDPKICDELYRFLAKNSVGADKAEFLGEIREKTAVDEIQASLARIQQEKNRPTEGPLVAQLQKTFQNAGPLFDTDQSPLLEALGDQSFLLYRITHSTDALNNALRFFRKAILFRDGNAALEVKILHVLWFRLLDSLFQSQDFHLLSDDFILPYWRVLASKIESRQGDSLVEALNAHPDLFELRILVSKILSKKILWAAPPVFFDLLATRGLRWDLPSANDRAGIQKITFSRFWASDAPTQAFLENKRRLFLDSVEKIGGNYAKDASPQNADNILKEGEAVLFDWISKNVAVKGNFEKLLERAEFSKALKPSLAARKLILDVKLARIALWFDPNREWIGTIPAPWVAAKFVKEGQNTRNSELQSLLEEAKGILEESLPFFLEDLYGFQTMMPDFAVNLDPRLKTVLELESALDPNLKKNQVRSQLFGKNT